MVNILLHYEDKIQDVDVNVNKNYTQHKTKYHESSAGLIGVIAFSWLKRTNFLDSSSPKFNQINSFKQEVGHSDIQCPH